MNSSYLNAAAGAFLAVIFVVMTVSIAGDAIFHSGAPEQEGYQLVALEGSAAPAAATASDALPPIAPLLAGADVDAGMRVFRKCVACHTVEDGGANKVGPNLWNVVDRPIAAATGFGYSSSMTDFAEGGQTAWDYEHLNGFLAAPKRYIRGTSMGFAGLRKEDERANVIAYLRSLSNSPAPLPSATDTAAEPASAEGESDASASGETDGGDTGAGEAASDATAGESDATSNGGSTDASNASGDTGSSGESDADTNE